MARAAAHEGTNVLDRPALRAWPASLSSAVDGATTTWFLVGFIIAFLSDIFDGVIVRRLGSVTARLREADGWTDVWFYLWIAASVWQSQRATVLAFAWPIILVISAQIDGLLHNRVPSEWVWHLLTQQ